LNNAGINPHETQFSYNQRADFTDEGILLGNPMAENLDVMTSEQDRLERFSIRDQTSDSLKIQGYTVKLLPTYQAYIELLKADLDSKVVEMKAAYDAHKLVLAKDPVQAELDEYIATLNGVQTDESSQKISEIRQGPGM
jgi:hypothetical protein